MLAVTSVHLFFPVGAETIEHTHIWATKYDSTNHWEYCTVCGEKRNVTAHTYTDHWYLGYESCSHQNYSLRTCSCGYSYRYHKPHQNGEYWNCSVLRGMHWKNCKVCGSWSESGWCVDSTGALLTCKNLGTCVVCGRTRTSGYHYLVNGKCRDCGKVFFTCTKPKITYNNDYSGCTVAFSITPVNSEAYVTGGYGDFTSGVYKSSAISTNRLQDGTVEYTLKYTFEATRNSKITSNVGNSASMVKINGYNTWTESWGIGWTVWQDHVSPVQNDVIQEDQASANGWATIKQLTLSGTENMSDIVYLTVFDKITGEKYVTDAAVSVTDGKYSYTCTPPIEADANGRTYVVTAKDRIGNVSTKEFVVYKTDGSAPALKAGTSLSYTDWTHTPKNISLSFYDFGAGGVQVSFDNQTSYQVLTKNGEYYIWNKSFGNQVGTTEHKLYVKDALGNATVYTLTVGNVDTNAYTITYNLDGGTISGQKTTYTVEDTFTLPQPTKTGYTFLGYVGSNGTTAQKSVTVNKCTRGNLTYTAQWQANKYNVTLDPNGGTVSSADADGTVKLDMEFGTARFWAIDFLKFTKPGYLLEGIYDSKTGGNKVYDSGPYAVSGTYWNGKLWNYAGDKAIYCRWKPITYIIKFDANGGTGTTPDIVNTYGIKNPMPKLNFTRPGWKLTGLTYSRERNGVTEWMYGNEDGTWKDPEQWYELGKNPEGTKLYEEKNLTSASDIGCTYINNDVITGHAQWQINTYDLSVKHTVSGNMGNKHSDFSFTLNLSGMSGNNITAVFTDASGKQTTKTLSMNNSKVAFTLKHGENVVFKSIPYNTSYMITENNADGYTVSNSNASGKVKTNTTVMFTSTRNATVPTSADTNAKAMVAIAGLSIIVAIMLILKRRKTNTK